MPDAGHAAAVDPVQRALAEASQPVRAGIKRLRVALQREVPGALPVLNYGVSAWRDPASGKAVCGFALTRAGWSLHPFSGSAVAALGDRLDTRHTRKGAIPVPPAAYPARRPAGRAGAVPVAEDRRAWTLTTRRPTGGSRGNWRVGTPDSGMAAHCVQHRRRAASRTPDLPALEVGRERNFSRFTACREQILSHTPRGMFQD